MSLAKLKNAQEERRARTYVSDGEVYYGENASDIVFELGLDVEAAEAGIYTGMSQEERLAREDSDESPFMRKKS
jgi:hypothetical protein